MTRGGRLANNLAVVSGHVEEGLDSHAALVTFFTTADRHDAIGDFLLSHDEEVRHLLEFALADLVAELFVGFVDFHTDAGIHEFLLDLLRVVHELLGNREHAGLNRSEPQREIAHEFFDKNTEEAFDGTHGGAVQHHRNVLLVVLADILGTKALREVKVDLDGTALPVTSEAVLQREFELRAVEGAFTRVQDVVEASELRGFGEGGFSLVPNFVGTHALFRAGGELHHDVVETEVMVDFLHEGAEVGHFACNLVFGTEDVGVILHKAAHAHQAVHRTGRFVTVALTEFGKAHRKVTPATETRVENLDVAGAVHRLHGHFHVASERLEHVLVVLVGVAGLDPQSLVHDWDAYIPALRLGNAHASVVAALALRRCPA